MQHQSLEIGAEASRNYANAGISVASVGSYRSVSVGIAFCQAGLAQVLEPA
jgi:hypothetical protein